LAMAFSTAIYVRYWGDNNFDLTGASSLSRVLNMEEPKWEQEYENYFSWPDARNYFYKSLTQESKATREHYLALTFLSFGHVMHLLEDLGVPPHARNDFIEAHFRGLYSGGIGNPFEGHIENEIKKSGGIPERWLQGWTPQAKVFSKIANYWDINDYNGQYVGTLPLSSWGLSEQTNYQFLSKSTIFRENNGTKYYFPHPDINNTIERIDTEVYLWGLVPIDYRYISGYGITHLARTKFTQKYAYDMGMPYPTETIAYHTTFDKAVYEDYAKVTIPRTIDHAAGLINYFFRGRMELRSWIESRLDDLLNVTLYVKNKSMLEADPLDYQFGFKGGHFEVYWEDAGGMHHNIQNLTFSKPWDAASTLAYNEEMWIRFDDTPANDLENAVRFIVVYRGNIVKLPEYTIDTDDTNAIAVSSIETNHIHNVPTTALLLARFKGVNEDWFDPAEHFNNHGFRLTWYESRSGWEANVAFDGRQISIAPTFQNNRDRIFVDVEDDWSGNRIFHSGGWDHLEYFPHVVENDCDIGTSCDGGYDGTCTVSVWDIPNWENGIKYTEGDHVGWNSPEGDCFEVYTCTLEHTAAPANQPDVSGDYWLLGYPDVKADLDIVGVSESAEESPGGVVTIGSPLVNINTMILTYWPPNVWTNELNRGSATLEVVTGADKIRIWDNPDKSGQPLIDQGTTQKTWQLMGETVPINLYVEGVAASGSAMDVRLKFTLNYAGVESYDKVNFTVQP